MADSELTAKAREVLAGMDTADCFALQEAVRKGWARRCGAATAIALYVYGCLDIDAEPTELGREVARLLSEVSRG